MKNIFTAIPDEVDAEIFEDLLKRENIRIERIISRGQVSPDEGWYDQEDHEWVLVLEGCGVLAFQDGKEVRLTKGDYLNIPAHVKHRVAWTDPQTTTVWLAIFYKQ